MTGMAEIDPILQHLALGRAEHAAWLDVVKELRERGVGDIERDGKDFPLHNAIVRWGEELAQLRLGDPDPAHAANALRERREAYPGSAD